MIIIIIIMILWFYVIFSLWALISVSWSVGLSVCHNFLCVGCLHFQFLIGALVITLLSVSESLVALVLDKLANFILNHSTTGCSRKNVFFPTNSQYFATSPSAAFGCYWLFRQWPSKKSDCTLALKSLMNCRRGMGCSELWEKHNFFHTPCNVLALIAYDKMPKDFGEPWPCWRCYIRYVTYGRGEWRDEL